jgi:hypothetical protein
VDKLNEPNFGGWLDFIPGGGDHIEELLHGLRTTRKIDNRERRVNVPQRKTDLTAFVKKEEERGCGASPSRSDVFQVYSRRLEP